jgi:hypothetical protein
MANGLRLSAVLGLATLAGCASHPEGPREGGYPIANPGHHVGGGGYPGGALTIRCESDHGRTRHCPLDTRGGVVLSRRLSSTPCIQGSNWDFDRRGVWVAAGCRAEFTTGGGPVTGSRYSEGTLVRCESDDGRRRHCDAPIVHGVELRRNISHTPCIRGDNWGWDSRGVWVDHGCRGDFQVF